MQDESDQKAKDLAEYFLGENGIAGQKLMGRYTIIEPIGRGGKSIVFCAEDAETKKMVACKLLLPQLLQEEKELKRFKQEAVAAKRLDHVNINCVSDFGEWNGQLFMIMELLEGSSLADLLDNKKQLPIHRAVPIFIQIAEGCAYAHGRNIIHRDLKPGNVIIGKKDGRETVKIIDFGIAKIVSENTVVGTKITKTGEVFGSPLYMSPEQCMGQVVDHRSDIYSLGTLMYEALTGQPPLRGATPVVTLFMHTREMPAKFNNIDSDRALASATEAIVFKCLAKEAKQRYQSMDEVINALNKVKQKMPA